MITFIDHQCKTSVTLLIPAASATADPMIAPIALFARAEAICKNVQRIKYIFKKRNFK